MARSGFGMSAFMMAFILAGFTLGATGWYAYAGVDLQTGHSDTVNETVGDVQEPELDVGEGNDPGFLTFVLGAYNAAASMMALTYKTQAILRSYGIHWSVAYSIQVMIDFVIGITLLNVLTRSELDE